MIFLTLCDHFLVLSVTFVKSFRDVFTFLGSLCVLRYFLDVSNTILKTFNKTLRE